MSKRGLNYRRYQELLDKQRQGDLTPEEMEEISLLYEGEGEIPSEEIEKLKELQRERIEIIEDLQGEVAKAKASVLEDREEQQARHNALEKGYGRGVVAIVRERGIQEVPQAPSPKGGRIRLPIKERHPYEQPKSVWDYEGKPPEGHRTKRRK